jgi:hypothetical protein
MNIQYRKSVTSDWLTRKVMRNTRVVEALKRAVTKVGYGVGVEELHISCWSP